MMGAKLGKLALAGLVAILLAACAREPVKEPPAQAPVVQAATPAKSAPATVQRTAPPKPAAVNPLRDPGSILAKRSIFYALDNYAVEPEYQPMLKAHAAYLSGHPSANVVIEGNCDERGSREYNLALGQRRADNVEKMMVLLGASAKQIEAVSFGEEKPKAVGHDESSWSQNRRSDIVYKREQ
jgi:peptidoglycan-associated lipoprotein